MIGLDSNILVRIFARDHEKERRRAIALIEGAPKGEVFHLNWIVIVELAWTLRRAYRFERDELARVIRQITEYPRFSVPDKSILRDAAHMAREEGADLPDALVLLLNRSAGAELTYTFDHDAVRKVGMTLVPSGA
jgi:predicted nucleic-acid-binding protein